MESNDQNENPNNDSLNNALTEFEANGSDSPPNAPTAQNQSMTESRPPQLQSTAQSSQPNQYNQTPQTNLQPTPSSEPPIRSAKANPNPVFIGAIAVAIVLLGISGLFAWLFLSGTINPSDDNTDQYEMSDNNNDNNSNDNSDIIINGLQAGQQNAKYRDDMARLAVSVVQYMADNMGEMPEITNGTLSSEFNQYLPEDDYLTDNISGNPYTIKAYNSFAESPFPDDQSKLNNTPSDEMYIFYGATCDGINIMPNDNTRNFVVTHSSTDNSTHFCSGQ